MRKLAVALLLLGPILFISIICCTPSLHPLYTEDDVVFDPGLLGVWVDPEVAEDSRETWAFSVPESQAPEASPSPYQLLITDSDGLTGEFIVHLVNLEGRLFLDLYPDPQMLGNDEFAALYVGHLILAHSFMYVEQLEPTLRMTWVDMDWLESYLADHPDAVAHDRLSQYDGTLVFTAPTEDLQAFMLECVDTEGAIGEFTDLLRIGDVPLAPPSVEEPESAPLDENS